MCPSSIRCWNSNPQPLEHKSSPITTRQGLPSLSITFCTILPLHFTWNHDIINLVYRKLVPIDTNEVTGFSGLQLSGGNQWSWQELLRLRGDLQPASATNCPDRSPADHRRRRGLSRQPGTNTINPIQMAIFDALYWVPNGFASVNLHHQDESVLILSSNHKYVHLKTHCIKIYP